MFNSALKRFAFILTALLLIAFGFVLGTALVQTDARITPLELQVAPLAQPPITETERLFADIYNRVSPSVVSINVRGAAVSNQSQSFEASGTGFVLDTNGYIVTNNHVVDGATEVEINFLDGTIIDADIIGVDPDSDIAVLRVDLPAERLSPITFGDSDQLFIGQTTLAIGSPFGQRWTLTSGIISALGRTIQGLNTQFSVGAVIQTDAAINPGNSGGPLLNLNGEVIGVNSQIISRTRSNSGIGFAVPSNLVRRVAQELVTGGRVNYSYLGIQSVGEEGITLRLIRALNLPDNIRGVVVDSVVPNGPAAQGGVRSATGRTADIITAIDGQAIRDMSGLVAYLASKTTPGQTVNLTVWRAGETLNLPVTLGARP